MNVVRFRPRQSVVDLHEKCPRHPSNSEICQMLDLSRYESRGRPRANSKSAQDNTDDFKHRMRANIVVLILLVALAAFAAADFRKLQIQSSCVTKTMVCREI
jgi:hypothetical protein